MKRSEIFSWCKKNGIILSNKNNCVERIIVLLYKRIQGFQFEIEVKKQEFEEKLFYVANQKRGSCSGKHYLLGLICETIGLSVEYLTYPFYWHELPVEYPDFLEEIVEKVPLTYHLAIRVHVESSNFLLDATWDPPLKRAGFPTSEMGNKLSNMLLSVTPTEECITHKDARDREVYVEKKRINSAIKLKFYTVLNSWLKYIRKYG